MKMLNQDIPPEVNRLNEPATSVNVHPRTEATVSDRFMREQRVQHLRATFRNILLVVFLVFVFAVVQMLVLQRACMAGRKSAASLEHQGLPTLNHLASLQEHLVTFRLYSYEYLFSREGEKSAREKALEAIVVQTGSELLNINQLLPDAQGRRLASSLDTNFADLNREFLRVRRLADSDFVAAMKALDEDIPPRIDRVAAAAGELKEYGYRFSGAEANATFGSFGWINTSAIVFCTANIIVAFGATIFVLLAARRSRAQLCETLARLDERTQELARSLSVVNATLESTADGIVMIDSSGNIGNYNQPFVRMWRIPDPAATMKDRRCLIAILLSRLKRPEKFAAKMEELDAHPELDSFDVLEFHDERVFECYSKPQRIQDGISGRVWSCRDISEQKRMQLEVETTHSQLLLASRQAGMAEVATGVLHNVGNVLNSVNISTELVAHALLKSRVSSVAQLGGLLAQNADDLATFFATDDRGRKLPGYVNQLSEHLDQERNSQIEECRSIRANIDHIKAIVAMQQDYASTCSVVENVKVKDLIEDALRLKAGALTRHEVGVVCECESPNCELSVDRHKVLQILVNLISNAKQACNESGRRDKRLTLRSRSCDGPVQIEVADNGIGIAPENLTRIFTHGFTTKKNGHGFGLHSAALAAQDLGGSLRAHSDGPGKGATFTLELPAPPPSPSGPDRKVLSTENQKTNP